ncbi:gamma carbonic anhydrase family protein [Marinoscillum sp. MHG1-6]|uniref:gamma carbonic anhydrase family protein n=1 Tax=Marinoscillum sp. MHG1-6 TaxID=2959627 RepID=UPI0021589B74|nr:gamma carbonic anhydrase family protein [Marinoscillum sp. MHG1-6]
MAIIKKVRGFDPKYGKDCWFAETATLIGEVTMGDQCTVWYSAVVRGDVNSITIGDRTNIQDNATIHGTYEKAATVIGSDVSIGHNAIVHGCTLEDQVLIGMGAIVMDGAVIKKGAIVAAGAVVLQGTIVEENTIYAGVPAKKVKKVEGENREMLVRIAGNYIKYAGWFKDE